MIARPLRLWGLLGPRNPGEDRRSASRELPAMPPLASTRAELVRTAPAHHRRLHGADDLLDAILDDYSRMDGALALKLVRSRR